MFETKPFTPEKEGKKSLIDFSTKLTSTHFRPMITRTASCIIVLARSSTVSGKVALNNDRNIEGLEHALTTESTCFTRPSSNSLSDSSSTRNSTLQKGKGTVRSGADSHWK